MADLYFNNTRYSQIDINVHGGVISFRKEGVTTDPPTGSNLAINTGYANIECNEVAISSGVTPDAQLDIIFYDRKIVDGKDVLVCKLTIGIKQYYIDRILGYFESPVELYFSG